MSDISRFIIVRRGDHDLFERLQRRYAGDLETVVLFDRRARSRRRVRQPIALERRRAERRFPHDARILATRGYFVIRAARRGSRTDPRRKVPDRI